MSEFNPKFNNLVQIYKRSISKYADRPLFGVKEQGVWKWLTYRDFRKQVDQLRGGLSSIGVQKQDRVAVISNNSPKWAVGCYATYGLGAVYVPMYESQLADELQYILADCGAKVVLVADSVVLEKVLSFKDQLPNLECVILLDGDTDDDNVFTYAEILQKGADSPAELYEPDPEEIAGYIYTSGTTGNPKGVMLTHRNLANNVSAIHEVFPMSPEDRSLCFLPWAHVLGQTVELHGLFSMGASMGLVEALDKIVDNLSEVKPTLLVSVPRVFNRIYDGLNKKMIEAGGFKKRLFDAAMANEQRRKALAQQKKTSGFVEFKHSLFDRLVFSKVRDRFGGNLKFAFSGAAALSKEVAEFVDNLGITIYEGYGLSETSPIVTANWPGARHIGSVGKAIPGVKVTIDTEVTGDPVQGEIVISGHNVMKGYHNLPEEDAKVFVTLEDGTRAFRSGDMGYLDKDGFLYITGRIKEQYKLENGKYVVPAPLEEKLKLSPVIANIMIFGANKPCNVALIIPDMEVVNKWAEEEGIKGLSDEQLIKDERYEKLVLDELERYSGDFKGYEKVKKITSVLEDFSVENGMLTPSMKIKRRIVLQNHGEALEALYK